MTNKIDNDARFTAFARGFNAAAGRMPVFEEDYETATLDGYETEQACYDRGVQVAAREVESHPAGCICADCSGADLTAEND